MRQLLLTVPVAVRPPFVMLIDEYEKNGRLEKVVAIGHLQGPVRSNRARYEVFHAQRQSRVRPGNCEILSNVRRCDGSD